MTQYPEFGAGLWHFATYVDRYAVDRYGDARSTLEQIELAGKVRDLSWVDINYPFSPGVTADEVKDALRANNLKCVGVTPEIYLRDHVKGAFTNPDAGARTRAMDIMQGGAVREIHGLPQMLQSGLVGKSTFRAEISHHLRLLQAAGRRQNLTINGTQMVFGQDAGA